MQDTRDIDVLAGALLDLMSALTSAKRDEILLAEAGVGLDRALFPPLARLGLRGPLGVAALADMVGRDHTTISRQLARLEDLGLVDRRNDAGGDRRVRPAVLTQAGESVVAAITAARRRLLSRALADWTDEDRAALATLNRRFANALAGMGVDPSQTG